MINAMRLIVISLRCIRERLLNWLKRAGGAHQESGEMKEAPKSKSCGKNSVANGQRAETYIDRSSRQLIGYWLKGRSFKLIQSGDRWIVILAA